MTDANDLLRDAAAALRSFSLRALAVKPTLEVPYHDEPRTSPWAQFIEPEARRAHDLARTIRKHLADAGEPLPPPAAESHAPSYGLVPFGADHDCLEVLTACKDEDLRDALVLIGPGRRAVLRKFLAGSAS